MSSYQSSTCTEACTLDDFEFERGTKFVRDPHFRVEDDDPPTIWAITGRSFEYTVHYLPGRDSTPGPRQHRQYELTNEGLEKTTVTEEELMTEFVPQDPESDETTRN